MDKKSETNIRKAYLRFMKLECNYSANTVAAYEHDIDMLLDWFSQKELSPLDATLPDLEQFATHVREEGNGPASLARILCGVRSFYRFLLLDSYIAADPTELLETPVMGLHLPEVLTTEEIDRMEESIDLSKWEGQRNRAIIELLFSCGLRVSELITLRLSHLYLEEKFIRVTGKGKKERLIPISTPAIKQLQLWFFDRNLMKVKPGEEDYVFLNRRGAHLSRVMIFYIIKKAAEDAGITKTISPHTLRHSFATELLKGGADLRVIQTMLGHESISSTEIYVHLDMTLLRQEILKYHPRNKKDRT